MQPKKAVGNGTKNRFKEKKEKNIYIFWSGNKKSTNNVEDLDLPASIFVLKGNLDSKVFHDLILFFFISLKSPTIPRFSVISWMAYIFETIQPIIKIPLSQ